MSEIKSSDVQSLSFKNTREYELLRRELDHKLDSIYESPWREILDWHEAPPGQGHPEAIDKAIKDLVLHYVRRVPCEVTMSADKKDRIHWVDDEGNSRSIMVDNAVQLFKQFSELGK